MRTLSKANIPKSKMSSLNWFLDHFAYQIKKHNVTKDMIYQDFISQEISLEADGTRTYYQAAAELRLLETQCGLRFWSDFLISINKNCIIQDKDENTEPEEF